MTSVPPMNGTYNIRPDVNQPYPSYQSVSKLPPNREFHRETRAIAVRLRDRIQRYLMERSFPKYNEILAAIFDENSVGEFPSDRTMCFFVGDLDAFTPEFVVMLQREVLNEFPLWRLLAQFEGREIGVYPNAVWFGETLVEGEFDNSNEAYLNWFNEAQSYRDQRLGVVARQLQYVRARLPEAIIAARTNCWCFLGAFDRWQPHLEGTPIWILHDGASELSFDDEFAPVRTSAVSNEAEIFPEFCGLFYPTTDARPPFWLVTQLIGEMAQRHVIVKDDQGEVLGRIDWSDVIPDEILKRRNDDS